LQSKTQGNIEEDKLCFQKCKDTRDATEKMGSISERLIHIKEKLRLCFIDSQIAREKVDSLQFLHGTKSETVSKSKGNKWCGD
jgi:hypothetical protein